MATTCARLPPCHLITISVNIMVQPSFFAQSRVRWRIGSTERKRFMLSEILKPTDPININPKEDECSSGYFKIFEMVADYYEPVETRVLLLLFATAFRQC